MPKWHQFLNKLISISYRGDAASYDVEDLAPFEVVIPCPFKLSASLSLTHTHTHTLSLSLSHTHKHTRTHRGDAAGNDVEDLALFEVVLAVLQPLVHHPHLKCEAVPRRARI